MLLISLSVSAMPVPRWVSLESGKRSGSNMHCETFFTLEFLTSSKNKNKHFSGVETGEFVENGEWRWRKIFISSFSVRKTNAANVFHFREFICLICLVEQKMHMLCVVDTRCEMRDAGREKKYKKAMPSQEIARNLSRTARAASQCIFLNHH